MEKLKSISVGSKLNTKQKTEFLEAQEPLLKKEILRE